MPKTCGWYVQPFWSMTAAAAGGGYVPEIPDFTYTKTFARPLSFPMTMSSRLTSPGCDLAQKASADILNFSAAGTAPSKTILPVIEAAPVAPAAPSFAAPAARADLGRSASLSSLPPHPVRSAAPMRAAAQRAAKRERMAGPDTRASSGAISLSCPPKRGKRDDRQSPNARRMCGASPGGDAAQVPVPHVVRRDRRQEVPPPRAPPRGPFRMGRVRRGRGSVLFAGNALDGNAD